MICQRLSGRSVLRMPHGCGFRSECYGVIDRHGTPLRSGQACVVEELMPDYFSTSLSGFQVDQCVLQVGSAHSQPMLLGTRPVA